MVDITGANFTHRLLCGPSQTCHISAAGCLLLLQDGTSKMSKSAENDASRINLTDTPDTIRQKVRGVAASVLLQR